MVLDRLFNFRPRWPRDLPRLYPELDDRELCSFMSEAEYWRIRKLPMVAVLPLYSEKSAPEDIELGAGLSRLLIRDLMLVRDLSVRGPEDTPRFDYESATAVHASEDRDTHWVVGAVRASRGGFAADLRLLRPGQSQPAKIRVQHADFINLAAQCAVEIAGAVGATVSPGTMQMWRYGRPNSVEQMVRIGQLVLSDRESPQTSMAAFALYQENPALSIAMDFVDSDYVPARRALLLESFHNDPYYAQTCFSLFIAIWDSTGPQPQGAVSLVRRFKRRFAGVSGLIQRECAG